MLSATNLTCINQMMIKVFSMKVYAKKMHKMMQQPQANNSMSENIKTTYCLHGTHMINNRLLKQLLTEFQHEKCNLGKGKFFGSNASARSSLINKKFLCCRIYLPKQRTHLVHTLHVIYILLTMLIGSIELHTFNVNTPHAMDWHIQLTKGVANVLVSVFNTCKSDLQTLIPQDAQVQLQQSTFSPQSQLEGQKCMKHC